MQASAFYFLLPDQKPKNVGLINLDDEFFIKALAKAHEAMGSTHPNPSVGAILAHNGCFIAEGHTQPVGGNHAEVQALENAKGSVLGATLYVTLEPCSHTGRTPPCTKSIIAAGIKRVVYGAIDPNPLVSGSGIDILNKHGIKAERIANKDLVEKAEVLIKPFSKYILKKRPYVVLKIATSVDQKMASAKGLRTKISANQSDLLVHSLRSVVDCVMVGANTARIDNPLLNVRLGNIKAVKQPLRVVLSNDLELDVNLNIFDTLVANTTVITHENIDEAKKRPLLKKGSQIIEAKSLSGQILLDSALEKLFELGITSILLEAGPSLLKSALTEKTIDELWWFSSPLKLGEQGLACGIEESELKKHFTKTYTTKIAQDRLSIFCFNN